MEIEINKCSRRFGKFVLTHLLKLLDQEGTKFLGAEK